MFPSRNRAPSHQRGFLMPLAMFIIIALAGLGIAISKLTSASFSSTVQESIVVQSLFAAESGAQYAMHQLLFDVSDKATADTNCTSVDGASVNFTVSGLSGCTSTISCALVSNIGGTARVYDIYSVAGCGSGEYFSQRTVNVRAIYE